MMKDNRRECRWLTLEAAWAGQMRAMKAHRISPALSEMDADELVALRKEFGYCHVPRPELVAAGAMRGNN